jgi:hypothetical protein
MLKNIATTLGLRKKTFAEKVMDTDKKYLFLFSGLALAAVFGVRKAIPLLSALILKR